MYNYYNIKFTIVKLIILLIIFLSFYLSHKFIDISMLSIIPLSIKTLSFQTDFKKVIYENNLYIFFSKEKSLESVEYFLNGLDPNENYVCLISIVKNMFEYNDSELTNFNCEPFLIN
jgi:hypothetical protein